MAARAHTPLPSKQFARATSRWTAAIPFVQMDEVAYIALPPSEEIGRPAGHPYDFGGPVAGMGRLLAAHPRIGPKFNALFAEIMFAPGALDRQERELAAAVAASAQTCFY
jgi:alkylhydroperoxidase/carboxymuconolactone decarboxylase family protein YurZ